MRYSLSDLEAFWEAAAWPIPIVIIGGGRWGRVWASVIAAARNSGAGITIVARRNNAETREWLYATPALRGAVVAADVEAAFDIEPKPKIALVASKPGDHARDGIEAFSHGAHVLVEKPLTSRAEDAASLVRRASIAGRLLGVGTEFALLPAFHQLAEMIGTPVLVKPAVSLAWTDPRAEVRHGLIKARHDEITVLTDLMPHALSIFRILQPEGRFSLSNAELEPGFRSGRLELNDQNGGKYLLICNAESDRRRRFLKIDAPGVSASVDFALDPAKIVFAGQTIAITTRGAALNSTLRIEIGAFLGQASGQIGASPLTSGLEEMTALHAALDASAA